jgi:hypothetical protein
MREHTLLPGEYIRDVLSGIPGYNERWFDPLFHKGVTYREETAGRPDEELKGLYGE